MDEALLFLKLGLDHVLEWEAYDHILFLIVLAIVYTVFDWKKVIGLITLFTLGHTLTLALSAYRILNIDVNIVEFLIPVTIMITAIVNILTMKRNQNTNINLGLSFFFGTVHGLGFSTYFKMIIEDTDAKLLPLFHFAIGIEIAQILMVLLILIFTYIAQGVFKISKQNWVLFISVIVIVIVIPMLIDRKFW